MNNTNNSQTKTCKKCHNIINRNTDVCPYCGRKQTSKLKNVLKIFFGSFLAILTVTYIVLVFETKETEFLIAASLSLLGSVWLFISAHKARKFNSINHIDITKDTSAINYNNNSDKNTGKGRGSMGLFGPSKHEKELQAEIERLRAFIPPQGFDVLNLQQELNNLNATKSNMQNELYQAQQNLNAIIYQQNLVRNEIVNLQDELAIQDYGLYRPTYKFANSDLYKENLNNIRQQQKLAIKNGTACVGNMNWSVNGNVVQGRKMVEDMKKLLLRAFNVECDDIINNVKISNIDKSVERINKSAAQISKLGVIMSIAITPWYVGLKLDELHLALDFEQKKKEEKERIRELKEQRREEARVQEEIEEARKKLYKEQTHYKNALCMLLNRLNSDPNNADLLMKKSELEKNIEDTDKAIADVDYREANKRAGYVYVISNLGAFGENVYKIGMTRRLEPMDRINELSGASVPFKFDVHALIFTEDAPQLEAALHKAFESKKLNKINTRREFFKVSLDEIKAEVRKNFDKTVEWIDIPEAEQYRQSLLIEF